MVLFISFETRDAFPTAKIRKEGFRKVLMFGPNHILVNLRWDDGLSAGHENVCWWFLSRYKQLVGPSKLRNGVFLGKCLKRNLNFQN